MGDLVLKMAGLAALKSARSGTKIGPASKMPLGAPAPSPSAAVSLR
jgi:hypothetical protein